MIPRFPARSSPDADRPRPQAHFTPERNWINDPNGLLVRDGVFHLFFQYNPDAPRWGNLHWGHATSPDLVTWTHLPTAISPDAQGEAWSGSIVVDDQNTAGFGAEAMVAVYTQELDGQQHQSLAVSGDRGVSWQAYVENPVLAAPDGEPNFRDPKVVRVHHGQTSWWVMLLGVGTELWTYRSDDLKRWQRTATTTIPSPWPGAIVEVPDLVRVEVEDSGTEIWVLVVSLIPDPDELSNSQDLNGAAAESPEPIPARVRYLFVEFDGTAVRPIDAASSQPLDYGPRFYAAMMWDRSPHAPICVGWMDETRLAEETELASGGPATWCGRMSIPRRLAAASTPGGLQIRQTPTLRFATVTPVLVDTVVTQRCFGLSCSFAEPATRGRTPFAGAATTIRLEGTDPTSTDAIEIEFERSRIEVRRRRTAGSNRFDTVMAVAASADDHTTVVVIDAGSVEVFADGGLQVWSSIENIGLTDTTVTVSGERRCLDAALLFDPVSDTDARSVVS